MFINYLIHNILKFFLIHEQVRNKKTMNITKPKNKRSYIITFKI